jgi:hypothetical protein
VFASDLKCNAGDVLGRAAAVPVDDQRRKQAFSERPTLTAPQIIEHDPDDKLNSDES